MLAGVLANNYEGSKKIMRYVACEVDGVIAKGAFKWHDNQGMLEWSICDKQERILKDQVRNHETASILNSPIDMIHT